MEIWKRIVLIILNGWNKMKKEYWKPVVGYEGHYQVSNFGRVKSIKFGKEIILKQKIRGGYYSVGLSKNGIVKTYYVHRLVAEAFIDNPNNYKEVNDKDEDKSNNIVSNLEWCNAKYNNNYGTKNQRAVKKLSKPVIGVDKVTGLILEFPSVKEAERQLGISNGNICSCLKGRQKSAGGFYWYYADSDV